MWKFASKKTSHISEEDVYALLSRVDDPIAEGSIVDSGVVSSVTVQDKNVICLLNVPRAEAEKYESVRIKAESLLNDLDGVSQVQVIMTAEKPPEPVPELKPSSKKAPAPPLPRPDVKHILAISSGKGGVGKSTVSFNIATSLQQQGYKVGLLDADIYGPSQPRLSGLTEINYSGQKPDTNSDGKIIPPEAHGLKIMSMGFLIDEENPLIWRGPMVQSAVTQLFRDVDWDGLDYLIVDMPPGTGDAQLTLAQRMPPDGAVIVSTPQDLSLIDARKGLEMYKKTNVPVLGIIENMSIFTCPSCGESTPIFGHDGAKKQADEIGVPFLGAVPLTLDIRLASDKGQPAEDQSFKDIVNNIKKGLE